MGFFARLVGKAVGSEVGRRVIGKASDVLHKVIGKASKHYASAKEIPVLGSLLDAAEQTPLGQKVAGAVKSARMAAALGSAYGNGRINAKGHLTAKGRREAAMYTRPGADDAD